jgi:hypothetical protein
MPTRCLPAASLRTAYRLPAAQVLMWVASYLIYKALWPIWRAISVVGSIFLPALREMPGGGSRSAGQALGAGGDVVEGECHRHAGVKAHQADHVGDALMAETSTALRQRQPDLVRDDLRERLALVQASKLAPIPIEDAARRSGQLGTERLEERPVSGCNAAIGHTKQMALRSDNRYYVTRETIAIREVDFRQTRCAGPSAPRRTGRSRCLLASSPAAETG